MPDNAILLTPFTRDEVQERLETLRIAPLFHGVRGEPPMDVDSYIDAVMAVGTLMMNDASVLSIDLNPVLVEKRSEGCCALDAVVVLRDERNSDGQ
jgi:hypothetical protein